MKTNYCVLLLFLIWNKCLYACTTCNKDLQQAIIENYCSMIILTLISILILLLCCIFISTKIIHAYYSKHGAGFLNPSPLIHASLILGIGIGGFVDGIIFHQVLQWHEMISNKLTPYNLANKSVNMFWDGIFHLSCLGFVVAGVYFLWRLAKLHTIDTSGWLLVGGLLSGWAIFNLIEGVIDHELVHLHHVREGTNYEGWNIGFLIASFVLLIIGVGFIRIILKQYKHKNVNP